MNLEFMNLVFEKDAENAEIAYYASEFFMTTSKPSIMAERECRK